MLQSNYLNVNRCSISILSPVRSMSLWGARVAWGAGGAQRAWGARGARGAPRARGAREARGAHGIDHKPFPSRIGNNNKL